MNLALGRVGPDRAVAVLVVADKGRDRSVLVSHLQVSAPHRVEVTVLSRLPHRTNVSSEGLVERNRPKANGHAGHQ